MRKIWLSLFLLAGLCAAHAENLDINTSYIYSSEFNQLRAGAAVPISYYASIGLEGKYVEDKSPTNNNGFMDPVYSVYMPIQLNLDIAHLDLAPFYYFENDSQLAPFRKAGAYGLHAKLTMDLVQDEVDERRTQGYISVSYVRQKANLQSDNQWSHNYYDQAAFTLGIRQNFFGAFIFQADGTAFQYSDGISQVQNFYGIVDQKDLAFTQSFEVNRSLGKYTLSARITRAWTEQHSSLYLGYHYAEFYTADPQHSFLVGNTFRITKNAYMDLAYNHLQTSSNQNKRDLFFANLNIAF